MNLETYNSLLNDAESSAGAGRFSPALEILHKLLESDIPDLDRCRVLVAIASVNGRMEDPELALANLDEAINTESKYKRFSAMEAKAGYLGGIERFKDSLELFLKILHRTDLTLADIARIDRSIEEIRKKINS